MALKAFTVRGAGIPVQVSWVYFYRGRGRGPLERLEYSLMNDPRGLWYIRTERSEQLRMSSEFVSVSVASDSFCLE